MSLHMHSKEQSDEVTNNSGIECYEPEHLLGVQTSQIYPSSRLSSYSKKPLASKQLSNIRRTLSNNKFCSNCERNIQKIEDLQIQQKLTEERVVLTEQHLKQYDELLVIKDARLKDQEKSLKAELEKIAEEKNKILEMRYEIESEKDNLKAEMEKIYAEKENLNYELELLDQKNEEIQQLIDEYEHKKMERKASHQMEENLNLEYRENLIISREEEIKKLFEEAYMFKLEAEENYQNKYSNLTQIQQAVEEKQLKIEQNKKSLKSFAKSLQSFKEQLVSEQKINNEKLVTQNNILKSREKSLEKEKKKIGLAHSILNKQIQSIEKIISNLKVKEDLKSEKSSFQLLSEVKNSIKDEFNKIELNKLELHNLREKNTDENIFFSESEDVYLLKTQVLELKERIQNNEIQYSKLEYAYNALKDQNRDDYDRENGSFKSGLNESDDFVKEMEAKYSQLETEIGSLKDLKLKNMSSKTPSQRRRFSNTEKSNVYPSSCRDSERFIDNLDIYEESIEKDGKVFNEYSFNQEPFIAKLKKKICDLSEVNELLIKSEAELKAKIAKYEQKISEGFGKIEKNEAFETQTNNDTITTLQNKLFDIESQYKTQTEEYKTLENKYTEAEKVYKTLLEDYQILENKLGESEKNHKILSEEFKTLESKLFDSETQLEKTQKKTEFYESTIASLEEKAKQSEKSQPSSNENASELEKKLGKLELDYNDILNKNAVLQMDVERFRSISDALHSKLMGGDQDEDSDSASSSSSRSLDTKVKDMKKELESKLKIITQKEADLLQWEENLTKERESIESAAQYIKTINEDLVNQQDVLSGEKEKFEKEKINFVYLHKKLDEKNQILEAKEQEIIMFKEKLDEREKLLSLKEKVNSPESKSNRE